MVRSMTAELTGQLEKKESREGKKKKDFSKNWKMVFHLCTARVAYYEEEEGVSICLYSTANEHCVILYCIAWVHTPLHAITRGRQQEV